MTLRSGSRLGPYEVIGRIGEGGMGVVFRARDDRLARDVAVKVIPPAFSADPERLRRFQLEARAAGQLNHPNIVTIHDLGTAEGSPYIVSEMLEGETLRDVLARGPLPPRRALAYVIQLANGLASAHAAGIVHRDLKPENLFLTKGGTLKILDFGIAKLFQADQPVEEQTSALQPGLTQTGTILGTASYMAPEQLRQLPVDHRADLFAFGAILHEMLTAERAFPGATPAERLAAILHSEPPPLPSEVEHAIPGMASIILRCLEKRADDRMQSALDLAFALELVAERSASGKAPPKTSSTDQGAAEAPRFERVTYREGNIRVARFAPDGQSVLYGAALEGKRVELFMYHPGSPESRSLGFSGTDLFAVASTGELAVSVRSRHIGGFVGLGTLGRMPLGGGAPRELLEDTHEADWDPEGRQLAVVREVRGMIRLEYPMGRVLYHTTGWISHVRISPDGKWIAFLDHPARGDDWGSLFIVDREGTVRALAGSFSSSRGVAWKPDSQEIWFSAAIVGADRAVLGATLEGIVRTVLTVPGTVDVMDISRSGKLLVAQGDERLHIGYRDRSGANVRDLSWLDWSLVRDMTADGRRLLFDETGAAGGPLHAVYIRDTDGSPAVRLGEGTAIALSPDGRWALSMVSRGERRVLQLLPVGAGETKQLPVEGMECHWGGWFPDGKGLWLVGSEPKEGLKLYRFDIERGRHERISDEEVSGLDALVSHDGQWVAILGPEGEYVLQPVGGGERRSLPGIPSHARIIGWSADDEAVFYFVRGQMPAPVYRLDVKTGDRIHWADIGPPSPAGVITVTRVVMSPDAESFAYSYPRFLTTLHIVEGLR